MDEKIKKSAFQLHKEGDAGALFKLIQPFLEKDDPYAHYFYSRIGLTEWNESVEAMERRMLKHLQIAAEGGVPEAKFHLGCMHLWGEDGVGVEKDQIKCARLIKEAAEAGHSEAKIYYGKDLVFGRFGIQKDVEKGLDYLQQAIDEGVEDAEEHLAFVRKCLVKSE